VFGGGGVKAGGGGSDEAGASAARPEVKGGTASGDGSEMRATLAAVGARPRRLQP